MACSKGLVVMGRSMMRWEQAIVYAVGALLVVGAAASVFQLYGTALILGCILMVLSLGDGPRGLSPWDFPAARISQEALDALVSRIKS